jgi:hypothetical protein
MPMTIPKFHTPNCKIKGQYKACMCVCAYGGGGCFFQAITSSSEEKNPNYAENIYHPFYATYIYSRSETRGKFWNVVLEKDGEDQLDRSCEKWRNVT